MTSRSSTGGLRRFAASGQALAGRPAADTRLDLLIAIVSCLIVFGLFIDGWAHNHGQVDDSFFTLWHALLYGAVGLAGLILIFTHFRNVGKGYLWRQALPLGYMLSLGGFFAFALGGLADMLWHTAFGIEENIEALLSPTHLFLAIAGSCIIFGPVRALWQRESDDSWRSLLPVILTFTCMVSVFTFFTNFAAITSNLVALTGLRPAEHKLHDIIGTLSLVIHSNILLAVTLFMARRWRLPFGALTLMFTVNALLLVWMHVADNAEFLLALNAAAIGLLGDVLLRRGILDNSNGLRFFAFVIPWAFSLGPC